MIPRSSATVWTVTGGILLLLGAAHHLTVWIGQFAFALGAVLLWINTPELPRSDPDAAEARAGGGLTLMLMCSLAHCFSMLVIPTNAMPIAAGIVIAHGAMVVMLAGLLAGPACAMRLGGWAASYGVLLGLGAMSLKHLLPQTLIFIGGDRAPPPAKVAYGFGAFAFEATLLLLVGAVAWSIHRLNVRPLGMACGAIVIVLAASLAGWRLAAL